MRKVILAAAFVLAFAAPVAAHKCTVPGSVYVKAADGCVLKVRDPAEMAKAKSEDGSAYVPDVADDPACAGKDDGFKYDVKVKGPSGEPGIAHKVCGTRPSK